MDRALVHSITIHEVTRTNAKKHQLDDFHFYAGGYAMTQPVSRIHSPRPAIRNSAPRSLLLAVLTLLLALGSLLFAAHAQTATATLSGTVADEKGAVIPGAQVTVTNSATGLKREATTNGGGFFTFPLLQPATYSVRAQQTNFAPIEISNVVLNVGDQKALQIQLKAGDINATVQVVNDAQLINESPAVSTVVDRQFVENIPLNGRSFQSLILLTPGTVTTNPQSSASLGAKGELSVNGQRTEANYYTVDGVSANVGIFPNSAAPPGGASSGSLPSSTALGTTQGLASVDALEEFRVQTSNYSAEYGRYPGGQFSLVTRSGTNQWHGTAFDYLRNDIFDASDWFNNALNKAKPPLRQNDFGGTLGGPVDVPHVYNGKDKTFFFFSYEGLRLRRPQAASVTFVPTVALRQSAPSALQPVLNAFPLPNGTDLGNGLAQFIGNWSNPSSLDSTSVRLDHVVSQRLRLFFRFSSTPSNSNSRFSGNFSNPPSETLSSGFKTRTYTFGATSSFSSRVSNEFRLNFSSNSGTFSSALDNFGGAQPVSLFQLQGFSGGTPTPNVTVNLNIGAFGASVSQFGSLGEQKQWNVVDTLGLSLGRHQVKVGVDFRALRPRVNQNSPVVSYTYSSATSVQANSVNSGFAQSFAPAFPVYTNLSVFAQDEWKLTQRLNLSMGLRWDLNPAPGAPNGNLPYTVQGSSLSTLTLGAQGTPLWNTTWYNFAPRLGAAYLLRRTKGWETVLRGGVGVFFDTGQQLGSQGYSGVGFSGRTSFGGPSSPASFPLPPAQVTPAIVNPPVAPYGTVFAFPAHLQVPYTLQWNGSIQQALGQSQALTVSYIGNNGRRLLEFNQITVRPFNPAFSTIIFVQNGLTSDYDALQVQFQRRLAAGLQALVSYSWGHAIDYGSQNTSLPSVRGNSEFDIRHNFSGALTYDLPNAFHSRFARVVLHHWSLDDRFVSRTGFPVTLNGNGFTDPTTGQRFFAGLNVVPGVALYLYGSQYPGGRSINPAAFILPPAAVFGNAPRNFARGFGAWQMDLAVRREFPIREKLKLQFRAEAFNIFNHANFGTINPTFCSGGPGCTFGQATATLANSLGGLSSLYQTGGARSMQLALRLVF